MPSIVILSDDGEVLFQNVVADTTELQGILNNGLGVPGIPPSTPAIRHSQMVILVSQPVLPEKISPKLTLKQAQVLQYLATSFTPEQIALNMNLSEESIRKYIKILKDKFKVESRDQLMAMAGYLGVVNPFKNHSS